MNDCEKREFADHVGACDVFTLRGMIDVFIDFWKVDEEDVQKRLSGAGFPENANSIYFKKGGNREFLIMQAFNKRGELVWSQLVKSSDGSFVC